MTRVAIDFFDEVETVNRMRARIVRAGHGFGRARDHRGAIARRDKRR